MSYARDRSEADKAAREEARVAREARRQEFVDTHKAAVEAQQTEEIEFLDAGYDETMPGQVEVEAGTVAHVQVLNTFPNATSYGPDVNVVVPPEPEPEPEPEPDPPVTRQEQTEWQR